MTAQSQNFEIVINKLHAKVFANTWKYDESILKEYNVYVDLIYTPGGGKFKRGSFETAYNQTEASKKAVERLNLRAGDKVLKVTAVCIDTAN